MMTKTVKAKLIEKKEICPEIKSFLFHPDKAFVYTAGQFAFFTFEIGDREFSKHFTISNSPLRKNIEMTTIMTGSDYKNALDSFEEGNDVKLRGPFGRFTLDALEEEYVCFLAGGIGITPIKSMLEYACDASISLKGCLFYSNRSRIRIAFAKELDDLAKRQDNFSIVNTLTDKSDDNLSSWQGETGYIDPDMIKKYFSPYKKSRFYIVGPPAFNGAMKKMTSEKLGVEKKRISLEKFSGY